MESQIERLVKREFKFNILSEPYKVGVEDYISRGT